MIIKNEEKIIYYYEYLYYPLPVRCLEDETF